MSSVATRVSSFFKKLSSRRPTSPTELATESPTGLADDSNNEPSIVDVKVAIRPSVSSSPLEPLKEACPSPATLTFERVTLCELEMLGVLGVGTYGVVKLARHKPSGRAVALKVISKEFVVSNRQEKHIVRERFVHLRLRHPFVTTLYQTLQDDDCLYLVLEYLPGGELFTVVHSDSKSPLKQPQGGLPMPAVVFYAACIILALDYLHVQGTIYRDLKLENLVLDAHGYPKVLDFGFAKPDAVSQRNGTMCGSIDYMAPEVVRREGHDHRADVWSFGVLLHELCLGTTPFARATPRDQLRAIQVDPVEFPNAFEDEWPDMCHLVACCLEKDPAMRFADMAAMKSHAVFERVDWHALSQKQAVPPFVPHLHGAFDTSRFEFAPDDPYVEPYDDDGNDWAKDF